MLTARKPGVFAREYEIEVDGRALAAFRPSWWKSGGGFTLDGREYTVRSNVWGAKYGMTTPDGRGEDAVVATADRVGRKTWTVEAGGRTYRFRRTSIWSGDQALLDDADREVGSIRKLSAWKGGATADLPGLDVPVQVFVVAVVITMWDNQASAAAASGGGGS